MSTLVRGTRQSKRTTKATVGKVTKFRRPRAMTTSTTSRSSLDEELKFFDTVVAGTALATTGVITSPSLNIIPQNTTESGRVGRKCIIKKLNIRFLLQFNSSTTETAEVVRVIVVLDRQANGATFAITDVLELASEGSFNNLSNKSRFLILFDRYEAINKTVDVGTNVNQHVQAFTMFKNVNIPIEWDNSVTTGALTSIRSNNIAVFALTLNSTQISLGYTARVRFID